MDAVATLKNTARIAFARGLSGVSRAQEALEASGARALHRVGLPTLTDIDRLARAVSDLDRATDSLRGRNHS